MSTAEPLWAPDAERKARSNLAAFRTHLAETLNAGPFATYADVHEFSVRQPEQFWNALWDFAKVKASRRGDRVLIDPDKMPGAKFFPDARLNYAENLLVKSDDSPALIFRGEDKVKRQMSWRDLNSAVARLHHAFATAGLKPGDRVAGIVPNMPETIVAFLAVTSLGGIWSSCSPDFGERGILDRFGQIEPRFLVVCDGYYYNGKPIPIANKVATVLKELPSVEETIIIDYLGTATDISRTMPRAVAYEDYISRKQPAPIKFAQLPFDHPLYILYSSGTTGIPKCIVHSAGGALLKHLSELLLNSDVKPQDRLFYFTTCGWMMWNWLVSGLATGATLLLYDGSPFAPSERVLFDYADARGHDAVRHFGEVYRCREEIGTQAARDPQARILAHHVLDRLAACRRELRFRLSAHQERPPSGVDLGRHRYLRLLRRRQSAGAGVARRDPGPDARHGGRCL